MAKKAATLPYTKKPSRAPTFDAGSFTAALVVGKPISQKLATQYVNWKRWVESSNQFAGSEAGGIRDVFNADMLGVDALKVGQDAHSQAIIELRADVEALKEAPPARPFP